MRKLVTITAIILLLFNGTGALFGGWHLITQPNGSSIGLPLAYLSHSPFSNYLVPGYVLFIANGLGSLAAMFALFKYKAIAPLAITAQGLVLCVWIVVQVIMIGPVYFLQALLGAVGVLLIVCGQVLKKTGLS